VNVNSAKWIQVLKSAPQTPVQTNSHTANAAVVITALEPANFIATKNDIPNG